MLQNTQLHGVAQPDRTRLFYRLLFAIIGLLAAEATIAVWMAGQPLGFYFMATLAIGWAFVGLPVVVPWPSSLVSRIPWPVVFIVGVCLGPLALAAIFVTTVAVQALLGPGLTRMSSRGVFLGTESLWPLASLLSTVSILTYSALIRLAASNLRHHR